MRLLFIPILMLIPAVAGGRWQFGAHDASPAVVDSADRAYPHEPSGFQRIVENRFDCLPDSDCEGIIGNWRVHQNRSSPPRLQIVTDTSAPTGGTNRVLRIEFPTGLRDGISPGHLRAWGADHREYREVYFSEWIKIGDDDGFQNQSVGTKLWYIAYGRKNRQNQFFVMLMGRGHQLVMRDFRLRLDATFEYAPPGAKNHAQDYFGNQGIRSALSTGQWHRLELLLSLNDDGRENGTLKVWVDGRLYASHHTVTYVNSKKGAMHGFYELNYDPIYGGNSGDVRTRNDYIYVDQVYMSGIPMAQGADR